jgi:chromosome segregation ATPase
LKMGNCVIFKINPMQKTTEELQSEVDTLRSRKEEAEQKLARFTAQMSEGIEDIKNDFSGLKESTIHALEYWKGHAEYLDQKVKILADENTNLKRRVQVLTEELLKR